MHWQSEQAFISRGRGEQGPRYNRKKVRSDNSEGLGVRFRGSLTLDNNHGFLVLLTVFPSSKHAFPFLCHNNSRSSRKVFNFVKLMRCTQILVI